MPYEIIFQVLIVLASAVIIGEIFEQFGLPSVAGELLAGMILGPNILNIIIYDQQIQAVSSISLFFIIFLIGFEMRTETVKKRIHRGVFISVTSFLIPLLIAIALATRLLPFGELADIVLALAIAVPSISIISVLVMQYDLLQKETGHIILSSVAITDIVAFILLAGLSRSIGNTIDIVIYTLVFVVAFALVDYVLNSKPHVFKRFLRQSSRLLKREDISYAILIIVGLLISSIFEFIGISYIIGAFFAGLIVHDGLIGRGAFQSVSTTFARMNRAFFIPLFFGFAGVEAKLASANYPLLILLAIVIVASIVPALLLTYFASKYALKLEDKEGPRQIAVMLGGRGAVGIVIASVAINNGLINGAAYSLVIVGTLAISIIIPMLLKRRKQPEQREQLKKEREGQERKTIEG